jgi:hypothetical protein
VESSGLPYTVIAEHSLTGLAPGLRGFTRGARDTENLMAGCRHLDVFQKHPHRLVRIEVSEEELESRVN